MTAIWGHELRHKQVLPGYFEAMGLPLVKGRAFQSTDDASAPRVVVVNAAFARDFFPGEDPLGRRISFARPDAEPQTWRTIVAIATKSRMDSPPPCSPRSTSHTASHQSPR